MKKDHNSKLTDDQKKELVEGAQFAKGGDSVDRLFDEVEALLDQPKPEEKSHAE